MVGALQATGLKFAYDIWNEPDISVFWPRGMATTQYFQMWDSAYKEIRSIAPSATIVGPDFAYTPQQNPASGRRFSRTSKAAGTIPDEITNHDEGDGDDPVTIAQSIDSDLAAAGISLSPAVGERVPARRPADRRGDRLVSGPVRAVRVHERDARQLGLLPDAEPDRGPHPERQQLCAERELVGDASPTPT